MLIPTSNMNKAGVAKMSGHQISRKHRSDLTLPSIAPFGLDGDLVEEGSAPQES